MKKIIVSLIVIMVLIQLIPVSTDNPDVVQEVQWDSHRTKELFYRACGDCHSNKTKWPSYAKIAPISFIIANHVEEGREHFNVSMWGVQKKNKGDEAYEEVEDGDMPLLSYIIMHKEADLNDTEKQELIQGLKKTFN